MNTDASRELVLDVSALIVTLTLLITVGAGVSSPVRLLAALVFITFVPGWALLDRIPLAEGASKLALAVPLSLSVGGGLATLLVMTRSWIPLLLMYAIAGSSIVLIGSHAHTLMTDLRSHRTAP